MFFLIIHNTQFFFFYKHIRLEQTAEPNVLVCTYVLGLALMSFLIIFVNHLTQNFVSCRSYSMNTLQINVSDQISRWRSCSKIGKYGFVLNKESNFFLKCELIQTSFLMMMGLLCMFPDNGSLAWKEFGAFYEGKSVVLSARETSLFFMCFTWVWNMNGWYLCTIYLLELKNVPLLLE